MESCEKTALAEFWRLWRQEQFWECHEALEPVWLRASGPHKNFWQGLIHGAVALHHARRQNPVGAPAQLEKARQKLRKLLPNFEGVDLDEFLEGVGKRVEG